MAGIEFNIVAKDNASGILQKVGNEFSNLSNKAGAIASSSNLNSFVDSTPAPGNGNVTIQNADIDNLQSGKNNNVLNGSTSITEKLTLISDSLGKIIPFLQKISEQKSEENGDKRTERKINENLEKTISGAYAINQASAMLNQGVTSAKGYSVAGSRKYMSAVSGNAYEAEMADREQTKDIASGIFNILNAGGTIALTYWLGPLGTAIGAGVGALGNNIIDWVLNDTDLQESKQQSDMYKNKVGNYEKSYFSYYDSKDKSWEDYRKSVLEINKKSAKSAKDTGLTIDDFINYATGFSKYGVTDIDRANELVKQSSFVARNTQTSMESLLGIQGINERFSSGYDVNRAYAYSITSGLKNTQFEEFLTGLQGVIESGIAGGFVRSADEVGETMVMFSKLSNGDKTWEGKYGFQKLNQLNSGISNATALSNPTQMLTYSAFNSLLKGGLKGGAFINGQDALNTFSLMEKGLTVDSFKGLSNIFSNTYTDDVLSEVTAWKQLSGLNYTGAMKLYEMAHDPRRNGKQITEEEIKKIQADYGTDTDSAKIANATLSIEQNVIKLRGATEHELEIMKKWLPAGENIYPLYDDKYRENFFNNFDAWFGTVEGGAQAKDYLYQYAEGQVFQEDSKKLIEAYYKKYEDIAQDGVFTHAEVGELRKLLIKITDSIQNFKIVEIKSE